jgi:hypothetical protein
MPFRKIDTELGGEILLLAIVAVLFVAMFVQSLGWPLGAALMPRIVVAVGMFLWVLRVVALFRNSEETSSPIMDVGFGEKSQEARWRFAIISVSIASLIAGIWLLGWHVSLPLWMSLYLLIWGQVRWWSAVTVGLIGFALIRVFDLFLRIPWNEPLLFQLFR